MQQILPGHFAGPVGWCLRLPERLLANWFPDMGVSENVVYPIVPNGFADHYPYEKWLFHWEY